MKPTSVNIFGITYTITYVASPVDVDIYRRESLWGQIDFWTRTIRVYDNGRQIEDIMETIIHEIIHAIAAELKLALSKPEQHDDVMLLGIALTDTLYRNGWLKLSEEATELSLRSVYGGDATDV
jgi:hypothetical protein